MSNISEIPIPTQEVALSYLKRVNEDFIIETRTKSIANKIDKIIKDVYRISDLISFNYICYFTNNKLVFKLNGPSSISILLPSLPESCLWNETDLHIGLSLLQTDLEETYKQSKKLDEKIEKPLTLWQRIKNWFKLFL